MADISIEVVQAQHWIKEVQTELEEVRSLLGKVSDEITTPAGEDDAIMKGIEQTGRTLSSVWEVMCNGFKEACDLIGGAIKKIADSADQVVEDIEAVRSRIGT